MRVKLTLLALFAAAGLALAGCSQQKPTQAPPPTIAPEAAAPADELPPPDLSATAPEGISKPTEFAGQAPVEDAIDIIPAPPPPSPEPSPSVSDPSGGSGPPAEAAAPPPAKDSYEYRSDDSFGSAAGASPDLSSPSGGGGSGSGYATSGSASKPLPSKTEPTKPRVVAPGEIKSAPPPTAPIGSGSGFGGIVDAKPKPPVAAKPGAISVTPPPTAATSSSQVVMSKKADGTTKVTVYFATDRKIEVKNNVRRFGGDEVNGLYYGTVDVTIPPLHQVGAVESPEWWKMEFKADPDKHVVFQGFNLLKRDNFYASLSGVIQKSPDKEAFVFVHGFNTPFEDAARRTAQIEYDLKFNGAPIFYSWPSQGELSPLAYNRDATMSDRTVPRLKYFLKEVAQRTGAKRVHLIAHSMGNKAMVNALARVADEMTAGQAPMFNQIVLTAPDIDREVFLDVAQRIRKTGSAVTLYASKNDKALQASKGYNGFSRAGDAAPAPVTVPGIYTVDASAVTTDYFGLNHDFFASQKTVLSDLTKLLVTGATPDGRKLRKIKAANGSVYWVID